jgi:hypothetical protein
MEGIIKKEGNKHSDGENFIVTCIETWKIGMWWYISDVRVAVI